MTAGIFVQNFVSRIFWQECLVGCCNRFAVASPKYTGHINQSVSPLFAINMLHVPLTCTITVTGTTWLKAFTAIQNNKQVEMQFVLTFTFKTYPTGFVLHDCRLWIQDSPIGY